MQVETYEATETMADGTQECDAEALALIDQLGLEGQQKLNRPNQDGNIKRNPYRKMTAAEAFVYERLLSEQTPINNYADGPIPLRVLQVVAHARDLFDHLYVWHAPNADIKDPILVGINGETWSNERFILARWADELAPLDELMKLAQLQCKKAVASRLREIKSKVAAKLAAVEGADESDFVPGSDIIREPTFYE